MIPVRRIIQYENELTDDFAGNHIQTKPLKEDYRYLHSGRLWRAVSFTLYHFIARPLAWLLSKLVYRQRFANRSVLRQAKNSGAFIYANHTNALLDALTPSLLRLRGRAYILAGPDALSIRGIGTLVQLLGCIPLGGSLAQKQQMLDCISVRARQKQLIALYPEAHIWPWYTGIRPFSPASFYYPAVENLPVYALTNCYQPRRLGRRPRVVTYLDGPFQPDPSLPLGPCQQALRDACEQAMRARAQAHSTCEYIRYVKKGAD